MNIYIFNNIYIKQHLTTIMIIIAITKNYYEKIRKDLSID